MAKCTGIRCPMQQRYKVDECNHTDCPYRMEPMTNADRIRAMSDEELAKFLCSFQRGGIGGCYGCIAEDYCHFGYSGMIDYLKEEYNGKTDI